jgi:bifunctional DNA-binding transcriptional regulator/antitoxin component of YhaV-PrlF toxin-antitoxin module
MIRKALRIKPGDKLEYVFEGDHVTIRVHLGTRALKGVLSSKKGKGMSYAQIREAAAKASVAVRVPGERTKACRHQSDCSLSGPGP